MKSSTRSSALLLAGLLPLTVLVATAADNKSAKKATEAKAAYPLTTCVVSDEALGGMGAPIDYTYKQAGKPDRLVRFCCKNCIEDFEKEPAKYLKKLDEAAAGKAPAKEAPAGAAHKH